MHLKEKRGTTYPLLCPDFFLVLSLFVYETSLDYQNEGIKVIRVQSKFDMEFLNELVSKAKAKVTELETVVEAAREELDSHLANADIGRKEYDEDKELG